MRALADLVGSEEQRWNGVVRRMKMSTRIVYKQATRLMNGADRPRWICQLRQHGHRTIVHVVNSHTKALGVCPEYPRS